MARHNNKGREGRYISSIICETTTGPLDPHHRLPSVEAGFLHNAQELLLVHFSVSIPVCFIYHFLHRHNKKRR